MTTKYHIMNPQQPRAFHKIFIFGIEKYTKLDLILTFMTAGMGRTTANASSFDEHAKRGKRKWESF